MPKADPDTIHEHADLFLRAEPLFHELRCGIGLLIHVSSSQHEIEADEIAFLADKLKEAVEKLQVVWDNAAAVSRGCGGTKL